jgi:hypothetical protein
MDTGIAEPQRGDAGALVGDDRGGELGECLGAADRVVADAQAVDAHALDAVLSAWLGARSATPPSGRRVVAIDGKSARGARGSDGRAVHLLAAFEQASGVVLGQSVVDGKTNEITAFAPLLDRIDITGAIITADAAHPAPPRRLPHRPGGALHTDGQTQPAQPALPAAGPSLGDDPGRGPHPRQGSRPD